MSIADRRVREKEQRRSDIINTAEKLFFSRGYDDVSMDDIANEVELNKATLYLYFKNKESLFFAVVLHGSKILNSIVYDGVKNCRTGMDILDAVAIAYFEFVTKYPDYSQAYLYFRSGRFEVDDRKDFNKDVEEILKLRQDTFILTCNAVKQGISEGSIRSDLDPVEVTVFLTMILKGLTEMRPDLQKVLEGRGIDQDRFFADVAGFAHSMLMNAEKEM
jgi:TetR/AcrR family transcriptional regulator